MAMTAQPQDPQAIWQKMLSMQQPYSGPMNPMGMQAPAPDAAPPDPAAAMPQPTPMAAPINLAPMAVAPKGSAFGNKGAKAEDTTKATQNRSSNNYDETQKALDLARNIPEVQEAEKSNQDLSDYIGRMTKAQNPNAPNYLVGPLAALSDSMTGSHLAAQAAAQNPATQAQQILKFKDELNKRKNDSAKLLLDSVSKLKTGQDQNNLMQSMMAGFGGAGNFGSALQARLPFAEAKNIDNNMKPYDTIDTKTGNASNLLTNPNVKLTPQNFRAAANEFINAVQGGASTEGRVGREIPENYGLMLQDFEQKLGSIKDYRNTPDGRAATQQLLDVMNGVRQDWRDAAQRKIEALDVGYKAAGNPDVSRVSDAKLNYYRNRFPGSNAINPMQTQVPNPAAMQQAAAAPKYKIGDTVKDSQGVTHVKVKDGQDADQSNWKAQ